jgi:hypothetical protein
MALILDGTSGLSDVDGSAATPAIRGTDVNTGIFFPAADTIAFSEGGVESMRIDSSGNLLVGETAQAYSSRFTLSYNASTTNGPIFLSTNSQAANFGGAVSLGGKYNSAGNYAAFATIYGAKSNSTDGNREGFLSFSTNGNAADATERMRIDSAGNVGIGTSSPLTKLNVSSTAGTANSIQSNDTTGAGTFIRMFGDTTSGSVINVKTGGVLRFARSDQDFSNFTESMRIDGSGKVLVNATSSNGNGMLQTTATSSTNGLSIFTPASYANINLLSVSVTAAGTGWYHFVGQSSNATVNNILINGNGNVQNANNSYGGISDVKLKENIVDASPKLNKLMQVKVRNYNLKGDYEQHKQLGVIAQELEQVFPSMVEEKPDRDADGNDLGTTTKSVKYSVFVPMLIKALQEQQAIINDLTTRLTALENK